MDKHENLTAVGLSRRAATAGLLSMALPLQGAVAQLGGAATSGRPLAYSAAAMAIETAPIRLAIKRLYGDRAVVMNGGVIDLVGPNRKADIASNGETQMMRHSLRAPDMRVVMTVAEGHYPVLARRSASIASLADLKGKRILSYRHTTAGYFLYNMLQSVGLDLDDVTIVETPLGQIGEVVARGEVDAIAIWEPDSEQALRALRDNGEDVVIFSGKAIYHERYNLCATADLLADPPRRHTLVRLMRAIMDVTRQINDDYAVAMEAQAAVARSGGIYSVEEVALCWPYVKFVANFDDGLLDVFSKEDIWLAHEENRQPRNRAQLATLIDRSAYEEALALPSEP